MFSNMLIACRCTIELYSARTPLVSDNFCQLLEPLVKIKINHNHFTMQHILLYISSKMYMVTIGFE